MRVDREHHFRVRIPGREIIQVKNLRTVICECGHTFTNRDIKSPLVNMELVIGHYEPNFYGGNVKKFARAKCECGKEYWLYLGQLNGNYFVKDIQPIEPEKPAEEVQVAKPVGTATGVPDFSTMKRPEIFKFAKEHGIKIPSKKGNDEIIAAIMEGLKG
jgi:hypothetical protein